MLATSVLTNAKEQGPETDVWLRPERGDAAAADRTNRGVSSKKTPAAAPASVHFHNFRLK